MNQRNKASPLIFVPGGGNHEVILNWHGSPVDQTTFYAEAYRLAARLLVKQYGSSGAIRDFEALPIVRLYRHSLELYLKAVLLLGNRLLTLNKQPTIPVKEILAGHRLSPLLPHLELVFRAARTDWDGRVEWLKSKEDLRQVLNELDRHDPDAFAFEYPMKKQVSMGGFDAPLEPNFAFNMRVFAERIETLIEFLEWQSEHIHETFEQEAEAAAELEDYELEAQAEIEQWYRDEYSDNEP